MFCLQIRLTSRAIWRKQSSSCKLVTGGRVWRRIVHFSFLFCSRSGYSEEETSTLRRGSFGIRDLTATSTERTRAICASFDVSSTADFRITRVCALGNYSGVSRNSPRRSVCAMQPCGIGIKQLARTTKRTRSSRLRRDCNRA